MLRIFEDQKVSDSLRSVAAAALFPKSFLPRVRLTRVNIAVRRTARAAASAPRRPATAFASLRSPQAASRICTRNAPNPSKQNYFGSQPQNKEAKNSKMHVRQPSIASRRTLYATDGRHRGRYARRTAQNRLPSICICRRTAADCGRRAETTNSESAPLCGAPP